MFIRTNLFIIMMSMILTSVPVGSVQASENVSERDTVAKVIKNHIRWALTKDRSIVENTTAQDEDLFIIWTSSDDIIAGWSQLVKRFDIWMDPRFKATLTEVRDLQIHFARSGQVAWYSAMLDDMGEWDGKPVGARDIRWTGVLEKREGKWVFVQQHGSVARDKVLKQEDQEKSGPRE